MPNKRAENKRFVGLWITDAAKERYKLAASYQGVTLSAYITTALDLHLRMSAALVLPGPRTSRPKLTYAKPKALQAAPATPEKREPSCFVDC